MNTNGARATAKIFQFPTKAQLAASGDRRDLALAASAPVEAWPAVDFGSGWYHQAAVEDSVRARK